MDIAEKQKQDQLVSNSLYRMGDNIKYLSDVTWDSESVGEIESVRYHTSYGIQYILTCGTIVNEFTVVSEPKSRYNRRKLT